MNEAELVFSQILNCDRLSLYLNKDMVLEKDKSEKVCQVLSRRITGEPLQYILGKSEFLGLEFKIDNRALIPRPETEILVELAIKELSEIKIENPQVLDIGTGSGCIAISIAKIYNGARVSACDISEMALKLASENAVLNKAEVNFFHSDIFSGTKNKFDLIISNPPYISLGEMEKLDRGLSFEPQGSLEAGADGLYFYRLIISGAGAHLKKNGLIAFEVGKGQANKVSNMLKADKFYKIKIFKDYNGINRVVIAKKK